MAQPEPNSSKDETAHKAITEGLATILVPETKEHRSKSGSTGKDQSVFYNPIQQFNRDLSVLAIKAFGKEAIALKRQKLEKRKEERDARNIEILQRKRKVRDKDGHWREVLEQQQQQEAEEGPDKKRKRGDGDPQTRGVVEQQERQEQQAENGADATEDTVIHEIGPSQEVPSEPTAAATDPKTDQTQTHPAPHFRILDALSATGLRAIRYAKEIPWVTSIMANDLSAEATKSIRANVAHNELEKKIEVTHGNAIAHMYTVAFGHRKYDVIDLDPYGTAAPFFDAALQALNDGGLLCATCTDPAVWASGGYAEKCYALYGGVPMRGPHCHEAGLRIILHAIATSAARYGMSIEPLLSLSIDYYARVFVRVRRSPAEVKLLAGKTMVVYNCDQGCGAWTTQPLLKNKEVEGKKGDTYIKHTLAQAPSCAEFCPHCGFKTHVCRPTLFCAYFLAPWLTPTQQLAGPMYAGPIHSPPFIQSILSSLSKINTQTYPTVPRIKGMLTTALEEDLSPTTPTESHTHTHQVDPTPFFFPPAQLAKVVHCIMPTEAAIRGALRHLGYRVSRSHTKPGSIKTDAPWHVIWRVMREWVRQKAPIKEGKLKEGMAGWRILYGGGGVGDGGGEKKSDEAEREGQKVDEEEGGADAKPVEGEKEEEEKEVVFDVKLGADTTKSNKDMVRYQINPQPNWGPMNRARAKAGGGLQRTKEAE
ncbi:MAG: RNA methyltransferase tRNA(m5U54)methyltransferase [Peltula sp. TS41687]|nr:MAG: RNA methyltransferase tRNA(m5U54)methyltransferase [Peltula sp. TS41687]